MQDPMTMIYDMWWYLSASGLDEEQQEGTTKPFRMFPKEPPPRGSARRDEEGTTRSETADEDEESTAQQAQSAAQATLGIWRDICIIHALSLCSIVMALSPSIMGVGPLACRSMPQVCSAMQLKLYTSRCLTVSFKQVGKSLSPWPVLNSCVLVTGMSMVVCCLIQYACGMHALALCVAMHSTARCVRLSDYDVYHSDITDFLWSRILLAYASMC